MTCKTPHSSSPSLLLQLSIQPAAENQKRVLVAVAVAGSCVRSCVKRGLSLTVEDIFGVAGPDLVLSMLADKRCCD